MICVSGCVEYYEKVRALKGYILFPPKNSAFVDDKFVQATSIVKITTTFSTLRVGLNSLEEGKLEQCAFLLDSIMSEFSLVFSLDFSLVFSLVMWRNFRLNAKLLLT